MRVLLVAARDLARTGGVEVHVKELARGLAARGHAVEIFGRPRELPPFAMTDRVEPARYDVVHHHDGAWPRGVDPGPAYVRTLHYSTAAKMKLYLRMGRLRTLANAGNWRALAEEGACVRRRGRFIAVSRRVLESFVRHHGLDPARARVIPNGAFFAVPRQDRAALRGRWGIAADAPVLLTIGRADFVKGYDLLERAWRRAWLPEGALWVTVGGRGPERRPGRLVTGELAPEEVTDWIHAADAGALPSYSEGCSLALLEMLAGGLYTLAHDVGNADDVIRAGENGELVPRDAAAWATALARVLGTRRGAPGAPRRPMLPPEYAWDAIAGRVEAVYREALAGGTP